MNKIIVLAAVIIFSLSANAQKLEGQVGFGFGSNNFSNTLGLGANWHLGAKKKFIIGTGIRYTGSYGSKQYFTSAPASVAGDKAKEDSLYALKPSFHSLNVMINLGYKITDSWTVGFDIDALGFTFGSKGSPSFIANGVQSTVASAKPTSANILLIGNNDRGSLNSQTYIQKYFGTNQKYGVRLAFQYLFNEITTSTKVQTAPIQNDRFRVKNSGVAIVGVIKF